jgi:ribosome biogenesis GTPase
MVRRHLSQRQKERIEKIQERRRQQLARRIEGVLGSGEEEPPREGRVVARHGANLAVEDETGKLYHCLSRQNLGHVVCGDRVVWQPIDARNGVVTALQERHSVLARPDYSGHEKPLAANITQLIIVLAPEPEPGEYLIDQYLLTAEVIGLQILIAINKIDLLDEDQRRKFNRRFSVYERIGYSVIRTSARHEHDLDTLIQRLKGHTSILVGQSGVGKSSLVKALLPNLKVQIGRLSEATGLGRHTTSVTTFYSLPEGGELIDSPGVRSFRLATLSRTQLENGFREFRPYLHNCRFSNCGHGPEPGCALLAAVDEGKIDACRLRNFRHMAERLAGTDRARPR